MSKKKQGSKLLNYKNFTDALTSLYLQIWSDEFEFNNWKSSILRLQSTLTDIDARIKLYLKEEAVRTPHLLDDGTRNPKYDYTMKTRYHGERACRTINDLFHKLDNYLDYSHDPKALIEENHHDVYTSKTIDELLHDIDQLTLMKENQIKGIQSEAGKSPKALQGIVLAIEKIYKETEEREAACLWAKLSEYKKENPLIISGHTIYYKDDPEITGGRLYQRIGKESAKSIKWGTFRDEYVSKILPK